MLENTPENMPNKGYIKRVADHELSQRLESSGIVLVEGPKACGKTALAMQFAKSRVFLDVDDSARQAVTANPAAVLAGETPRLIDEWQVEPAIWNHLRRAVDARASPGQFILTGSAVPADDITRHTGAGRISRLRLRPMSLQETGDSNGEASLRDLLRGKYDGCGDTGNDLRPLVERLCVGGWPGNLRKSHAAGMSAQKDYLREIANADIVRVDGIRRDPDKVSRVIRSLARNIATMVSANTIAADAGGADGALDDDTVRDYLGALRRLMIVEEQPSWSTHLRSSATLRTSPKLHLADPSLAVAAMRAKPDRLWKDLSLLGFLFESLVFRDLSIHAQSADAEVYHYRDSTNLEVDAIVECHSGAWCAFEVKLGSGQIDQAAATLLKFKHRVAEKKVAELQMLGIIVGSGYGYTRPDGIAVIPIGALGV